MRNLKVRVVVSAVVAMTVLSAMTSPASAQDAPTPPPARFSPSALARLVQDGQKAQVQASASRTIAAAAKRKDSILDGGLIGAAIGGVGGSFLLVLASGGSDNFPRAMRKVSPLTALAGFGIGAAIDALR